MSTNTLRIAAATVAVLLLTTTAEARRYRHHHVTTATHAAVTAFCGDRVCGVSVSTPHHTRYSRMRIDTDQQYVAPRYSTDRLVARRSHDSRIVSGVSAPCRPWYGVTCGCELSLKIFGRVVNSPNLKQARVWGQVFRHTSPFVGAVVGRSSHVAMITGGGPGAWELFDPNSGGRMNRVRTSNLREFSWVVDPHSRSVDNALIGKRHVRMARLR